MKESERNERKKLNSQAFGTHKYVFHIINDEKMHNLQKI